LAAKSKRDIAIATTFHEIVDLQVTLGLDTPGERRLLDQRVVS